MEDDSITIMLIQQYAAKFGITFSSKVMDDEATKQKAMQLMMEAISGKRGPVTDEESRTLMIKLLYFARLREALGTAQEEIAVPGGVADIQQLMAWLAQRGGAWQEEFTGCRPLRAAINQELVDNTAAIHDGVEVAFFPPVTGG